jgi:malate dehydrogenase
MTQLSPDGPYNSPRMRDIAIIGAGDLGGALAHTLARSNAVAVVRLVDEGGRVAEGKALDLMQTAPVEGFATQLSGSTDLMTAGGASVVVVADQAGGVEWDGEEGMRLLGRLRQIAPEAIVLCAGASQHDLVDRGVRQLHMDPRRIFGTAPEALAAGARGLVALALNSSPRDVSLTIVGNPPHHTIVAWDDAALGGMALVRLVDEPMRRRLAARIPALWPPGPFALAAVAAKAICAISGRTRAVVSCFVAPDAAARHRSRTAALPVRLGPRGVELVIVPPLSVVDRVALDNALLL